MSGQKDWRISTDSETYFQGQKKTLEVADRRPVIRKASDLVGPGIDSNTVRVSDLNDTLATFNGYYSAAAGSANAPNATETFVGYVISDAEWGGVQRFTGLTSGIEYVREFERSPTDPETVGWADWRGQRIPATITAYERVPTIMGPGSFVQLKPPKFPSIVGDSSVYEISDGGIRFRKQGVYSGHVQVGDYASDSIGDLYIKIPNGTSLIQLGQLGVELKPTVHVPFTAIATDSEQGISVSFLLSGSFPSYRDGWWRFACTRLGDAV